jgi:photosystem II stability/assembly factor-like uncharacterized protein
MKFKFYYSIVAAALLMNSCSKSDSTPTPPPAPVAVDTLTAGWSKNVIAGFSNGDGGDIQFINNSIGYTSDSYTVLKSTNGGNTWNIVPGFYGSTNMATTADGKFFFINGNNNVICRSTDGTTFTTLSFPGLTKDISFGDNNNGICSTEAGILNTTNGGATWNTISPLINYANSGSLSTFMYNNNTVWVVYDKKVLHANGNLASWKIDSVNTSAQSATISFVGVYATSASIVYLSSYSGYIYKSTDGGNTFTFLTKLNTSSSYLFSDIEFVDANTGYISVGNRIFKTTDAGATWTMVVSIANTLIIEIDFADASHGWAICKDGTVLKLN